MTARSALVAAGGVVALLLAAPIRAQEPSTASAATALEQWRAAESAHKAGETEQAALLLRRTLTALPPSPEPGSDAADLRARTQRLLRKIDARYATEERVRRKAAEDVVRAAEIERKNGWLRTAEDLLALAATISPATARGAWQELARELGKDLSDPAALGQTLTQQVFGDATFPLGEPGWKLGADAVTSPPLPEEGAMMLSTRTLPDRWTIDVGLAIGERPAQASFVLGFREDAQYHLLELFSYTNHSALRLIHWDGAKAHEVAKVLMTFSNAERRGFVPLRVSVDGKRVEARVGDGKIAVLKSSARTETLAGRIGLFIGGYSPRKEPVQLRVTGLR